MLGNMLNDLAEAIRRWTEKKCFTVLSLLTTFVATRRCRCLLRSVRVNVMPGRLLFVISGILAGGIPSFCIELCCFLHPLFWPLVFLSWFSVLLLVCGHYHHDTQDVIMHESPLLVAIPLLGVLLVVLFLLGLLFFLLLVFCCLLFVVFVGFACLFLWFVLCFCFLAGIAYWTAYRSITSTFVAIDN